MDVIGAVDIGGTKVAVGLVSPHGQVQACEEFLTGIELPFTRCMQQVGASLRRLLAQAGSSLLGIGIGCTGQMDPPAGLIVNNGLLPGWAGQNPVRWLSQQFSTQAALENDADAAALAEWRLGAGHRPPRTVRRARRPPAGSGSTWPGSTRAPAP